MLAHSIKPILDLIPEALPFIKQALVTEYLPTDSRGSSIASALELKYHEVVDHKPVDIFAMEKVALAVDLYGAKDIVKDLSDKMIKAAQYKVRDRVLTKKAEFETRQSTFESKLTGIILDHTELAKEAQSLVKMASEVQIEPSDEVKRYSCQGMLNKKAAIESLAARFQATRNVNFVKIASAIGRLDPAMIRTETLSDICDTIAGMDKEAGLTAIGMNFYREAVLLKSAASALMVKLCGKEYPYESIAKLGKDRISRFIGEDVAKEMDQGPMNTKQVMETLPADLQKVMCDLLKNV